MRTDNQEIVVGQAEKPLWMKRVIAVVAMAVMSVCAFATDPPSGLDYGTSIDAFKTDAITFFGSNAGKMLGILVIFLGFAYVGRWLKKSFK